MKKTILAFLLSLTLIFVFAFSSSASETETSPTAYTDANGNQRIDYADGSYTIITPAVKVTDTDSEARIAILTTTGEVSATNYAENGSVNWVYTLIGLFQYKPGNSCICKGSDYKITINALTWVFSDPSNTYSGNAAYGHGVFEHKFLGITGSTVTVDLRIRCDSYGQFY